MKNVQKGLTLIEALIALAVLSIGLTGLAAMQINSLQFVHSAHYRSMASAIALDFEERLWIEIADNTMTGCPTAETESGTLAQLLSDWNSATSTETFGDETAPKMLKIPNMAITVGTVVEDTSGSPVKDIRPWSI